MTVTDTTQARRALATLSTDSTPEDAAQVDAQLPHGFLGLHIKSRCGEVVADRHEQVAFRLNIAALALVATDAVLICVIFGLREMNALSGTHITVTLLAAGALFLAAGFTWVAAINRNTEAKKARKTAADYDPSAVGAEPADGPITDLADLHRLPGEVASEETHVTPTGFESPEDWQAAADRAGRKPSPRPRRNVGPSGYPGAPVRRRFYEQLAQAGVSDVLVETMRRADRVAAEADAVIAAMDHMYRRTDPYIPDPTVPVIEAESTEVPAVPVEQVWLRNAFPLHGPEDLELGEPPLP